MLPVEASEIQSQPPQAMQEKRLVMGLQELQLVWKMAPTESRKGSRMLGRARAASIGDGG